MKFWEKVDKCDHSRHTEHFRMTGSCGTPYCGGVDEVRCALCRVFITTCRCGHCSGMSGWSAQMSRTWTYRMRELARQKHV